VKRREFVAGILASAVWPGSIHGQAMPVIGYLSTQSASAQARVVTAFKLGLGDAGFIEGQNVGLEYRHSDAQLSALPTLAEELVRARVNVIAAMGGSRSAMAAKAVTSTVPIVFTMGDADPVKVGVVDSLARPGGNLTGISLLGGLLGPKRLELLRQIVPEARTIGVLINPENTSVAEERQELESAIFATGCKAFVVLAGPVDDLEEALRPFNDGRVDALVITADPIFTNRREQIVRLVEQYRIPTIYQWANFVAAGGLVSYGTDLDEVYKQAGRYTGRILKGEKPADLPVQAPAKFQLAINLKAAKVLGLTIPSSLLASADEVFE